MLSFLSLSSSLGEESTASLKDSRPSVCVCVCVCEAKKHAKVTNYINSVYRYKIGFCLFVSKE